MIKEELKQEAEEYALNQWEGNLPWSVIQKSYYDGAEPREKRIAELEAQIEKMQKKLKADLIARLEEQIQYSTSPSCTKGMEQFIKSIEKWEIKEKWKRFI